MAKQSGKRAAKRTFSGNHQRSWVWGHHAVSETLRAGKWPVLEILATKEVAEQSAELLSMHGGSQVPLEIASADRLEQLVRSAEHQGLIARLGPFPYLPIEDLFSLFRAAAEDDASRDSRSAEPGPKSALPPLVVVCDRIQDAFNLGAILRNCDGAAVLGVIVGKKGQAEVTPHVARSSSGAVNYVPIAQTEDLSEAVRRLKILGSTVVSADSNATSPFWKTELREPVTIILGSEAQGVHPDLVALSDHRVCIPMLGRITSLNVAVASGIMLYEIRRQQSA